MKDYNNIKLLIVDCDGVLTDGKVIYDDHRTESKNFSAKDGLGIKLLSFIIETGSLNSNPTFFIYFYINKYKKNKSSQRNSIFNSILFKI